MRFRNLINILVIVCLIGIITACSSDDNKKEQINEELTNRLIDQADSVYSAEGYTVPGVIVMIKAPNEKINLIYNKGFSNLENSAPIQNNMLGMIGSNTKTFVVMTLLQMADQGLLSLEDSLAMYLPQIPNAENIKLKHLAYMSSGLYDYTATTAFRNDYIYNNIGQPISFDQIIDYIDQSGIQFNPGFRYDYCNTNTIILSKVIEIVTNKSIKNHIQDRFLNPLHLTNTYYPTEVGFPTSNYMHGYEDFLNPGQLQDVSAVYHPSLFGGAGCMISNIYDMEKWVIRAANGADISEEMKIAREEGVDIFPGVAKYKTGIIDIFGWYGHKGGLPGYTTLMMHHPQRNCTIVIIESSYEKAIDPLIHFLFIIQTLYPDIQSPFKNNDYLPLIKAFQ